MLIQRIWMGLRGIGNPKRVEAAIILKVAILVVSWKRRKFLILLKIDLPSSMAAMMVERLSSTRII